MILFEFQNEESVESWHTQNDVVMGGVSNSEIAHVAAGGQQAGALRFSGNVSLENDGGFAQILYDETTKDLTGFHGVELYVRGDDKTYQLRLETDAERVAYAHPFEAEAGWQRIRLAFEDFEATHRGEDVPDAPQLDLSKIETFGILIGNGREERFELLIGELKAYRA